MEQLPPVPARAVRGFDRPLIRISLFTLIAAVGGLFASFTLAANLLVLAVGATFMGIGLGSWAGRRPAPTRLPATAAWWLVPVLTMALVELFCFLKDSPDDWPTFSLLADPVLEHYLPRATSYFAWLTGFWVLVRR